MPTIIPVRPGASNKIFAFITGGKLAAADSVKTLPVSVKVFSPAPRVSHDINDLKIIVTSCGAGLLVSLLFATYGVDLSPGFF